MMRRFVVALGMATLACLFAVQAAEPPAKGKDVKDPAAIQDEARLKQEILARRFFEFEQQLLALAQRLERSPKQEDREKAQVLKEAIKLANESGVDVRFGKLVDLLQKSKASNLQEVKEAIDQAEQLTGHLRAILALLLSDSRDAQLKAEKERIQNILKELNRVIRDQKVVRAQTERSGMDPNQLAKNQQNVTDATKNIANQMGGKDGRGDGKGGEAKKGESRGEGKPGAGKGEGKEDTKGPKGEGKPGEGNKGKPGEGKPGEGKPGEGKPGEGKPGEGKPGEGKPGEGKPGEGKPGEGKPGEGKPGEGKPGEGKPGEGKPGEGKPGEAKPSASKPGESKSKGQGKGEAKGGDSKSGQGQAKGGDSKGGDSKGGQGQAKSGGQSGSSGQPDQPKTGQPKQPQTPGRQQVEDAIGNQKKAEEDIRKKDNPNASGQQDEAIKKLDEARKRLEEVLRQLREEELERLLAQLQARCEYMLQLQKEVYEGTVRVDKAIGEHSDKKPTRPDEQKSQQLADREGLIVQEAVRAKNLIEAEGSAVAFAEGFLQVIDDMKNVQKRLNKTDVGLFTQRVELDIIATLEGMVDALKKAQKDMQSKQSQSQPKDGKQGPQPLIDILAELKMIRWMQVQVNKRTEDYGKLYPGEQANDPEILRELQGLSNRQDKIRDIAEKIAKGKNR